MRSSFCLHGEPTGDETPPDDYRAGYDAETCRTCGAYTTGAFCPGCERAKQDARSAARWADFERTQRRAPLTLVSAPRRAA